MDKNKLEKIFSNTISHEEYVINQLKDSEYQKEFLNATIEEFLEDGDYDAFFQSLELVIKSRESISDFAKNAGVTRAALYEMFKGERVPRLDTVGKILKQLGFKLKVA
mgnify:FL=1